MDREAVRQSFEAHTEYTRRAEEALVYPSPREKLQLRARFQLRNRAKYPPREVVTPQTEKVWFAAAKTLNFKGSTGLGAYSGYQTIGDALGWDGFRITDRSNWESLKQQVTARLEALSRGGCGCGERNCPACPDDIKFFIKLEPHKPEKIVANRYRLISCLSLVDQMVDRILFSSWKDVDAACVMQRAGKSGWAPMPVGFYDVLECFPDEVLATDCSAFDWTYPSWIPDMILDIKLEQTQSYSPEYSAAARARFNEVLGTNCTIRLPDGSRLRQTKMGIMKSGWLLTISANSDAQELITLLAWQRAYPDLGECPLLWSMGDDVLMRWYPQLDSQPLVSELLRAGILSKFASPRREFSGFEFGRDPHPWVDPLYPEKHKFLLAHTAEEDLEEVITSLGLIYSMARPATRGWLEPLLARYSRWSDSIYKAWAHGLLHGVKLVQTGDAGGFLNVD